MARRGHPFGIPGGGVALADCRLLLVAGPVGPRRGGKRACPRSKIGIWVNLVDKRNR